MCLGGRPSLSSGLYRYSTSKSKIQVRLQMSGSPTGCQEAEEGQGPGGGPDFGVAAPQDQGLQTRRLSDFWQSGQGDRIESSRDFNAMLTCLLLCRELEQCCRGFRGGQRARSGKLERKHRGAVWLMLEQVASLLRKNWSSTIFPFFSSSNELSRRTIQ